ncbi:G-D-S-L family lipolytic protein [Segetibacter sp. 3557_3]|uniref:GDSL-type esterase/lipase family protein n=1 Tax=Segetibacter sp. 3557_3 TaxID=2547429 RepID=UPI0010586147|nr:GDSL-type esterase/lipase family protein [Segetibacter sp. 3557_3]TDH21483.1 G-D-S-L family lipolytic protein [Segetibacter sp. 3557_3]
MKLLPLLLLLLLQGVLHAQTAPPFWKEIVEFKKQDSSRVISSRPIVLVGSSSFQKWKDVNEYLPGYPILNRGFGGSTLVDVIRYAYDVILLYKPKQVMVYCGENDLASGDSIPVDEVVLRFKTLFGIIRQNLPVTKIDFVAMKLSPSRQQIFSKVKEANRQIRAFLKKQKNTGFVDVETAMLDANGNTREELFLQDRLHMKPAGYAIWQKAMLPHLLK